MGHLILSRNVNEAVVIDNDIRVTVVGVRGNQVRLSIDAPDEVSIWREELYERIIKGEGKPNRIEKDAS